MKVLKSILVLIFSATLLLSQEGKINVAVLKFDAKGLTPVELDVLVSRFRVALNATDKFNVLEREKIKEILMEQNLQQSELAESSEGNVKLGKILGVQEIITGDIGKIEDTYTINIRRINVETSKIVQTASADYKGKVSGLLKVMEELAYKIAENPDEKYVTLEKGEGETDFFGGEEDIFGNLYEEFNISKDPFKDSQPPVVELYYPKVKNGGYFEVESRKIEIKGIASDENGVTYLRINGEAPDEMKVTITGMSFTKKLKLSKGENEITIVARDIYHNATKFTFTVEVR